MGHVLKFLCFAARDEGAKGVVKGVVVLRADVGLDRVGVEVGDVVDINFIEFKLAWATTRLGGVEGASSGAMMVDGVDLQEGGSGAELTIEVVSVGLVGGEPDLIAAEAINKVRGVACGEGHVVPFDRGRGGGCCTAVNVGSGAVCSFDHGGGFVQTEVSTLRLEASAAAGGWDEGGGRGGDVDGGLVRIVEVGIGRKQCGWDNHRKFGDGGCRDRHG